MRLPAPREHTGNRQIDAIQNAAEQSVRTLNACPPVFGVFGGEETFTAGQTRVLDHGLGRKPIGFIVFYAITGDPALRFTAAPDALRASVRSTNAGTYRLWWF